MAAAHSRRHVVRAVAIVLLGFLASGILGLVRNAAFSAAFGAGSALDAFNAARVIPEAVYVLIAGGALGSSFIPVFARFLARNDVTGGWQLASTVMSITAVLACIGTSLFALAAPLLVPALLMPQEAAPQQALAVELTRILMITVALFSISGLLMGILNANGNFLLPALALSMNNLGQIAGALVLAPRYGVYGLAYGAVLGAAMHLLVQVPGLYRLWSRTPGAHLHFNLNFRLEGVREVLLLMLPRLAGLAAVQINFIVNTNLTSGMIEGSRTLFINAWLITFFALGVIAQSIGTAIFPTLSALASRGDTAGFRDRLADAIRGVIFLALPVAVGMILVGRPVIALLLERGAWTAEDTAGAAWALALFGVGIIGHCLLEVLARAFYALSDTRTPVLIGIGSIAVNVVLSLIFIRIIGDPERLSMGPFGGLALANSLATLCEAAVLWVLLTRRIGALDASVRVMMLRMAAAAAGMAVFIVLAGTFMDGNAALNSNLLRLMVGAAGAAVYFVLAALLRVDEAQAVPLMVWRRVYGRKQPGAGA